MNQILSPEEYYYKLSNMLLSSSKILRKVFEARWKKKTGKDWQNSEKQGKEFIEGLGKDAYKSVKKQKLQKTMITQGNLKDWDVSTFSSVLQNFGDKTVYKEENDGVYLLTRLRNDLAHHPTKKFSLDEYKKNVEQLKKGLMALQVSNEEILKLIEAAGKSFSLKAQEAVTKLLGIGDTCTKTGKFDHAIECYDEAATMPSLSMALQSKVFEKRAECYMKLSDSRRNQDIAFADQCYKQVLGDANLALTLNKNSWTAHYLIGNCYKWGNNLELAAYHFKLALSISSNQIKIKNDLDSCMTKIWRQKRVDNLDPRASPINERDMIAEIETVLGQPVLSPVPSAETYDWMISSHKEIAKGQEHVHMAFRYRYGWGVPLDNTRAADYFQLATDEGNAEGIFNLGLLYIEGIGIVQDVRKAYELHHQAATMSPDTPGLQTITNKNLGVANAQHSLGLMYENGTYVKVDYAKAIKWYTKGAFNGMGSSANNLGCMYLSGMGVKEDVYMAMMYCKLGLIFRDPNSAGMLTNVFLRSLETQRAKAMFVAAKGLGCVHVQVGSRLEQGFNHLYELGISERERFETHVAEFETEHGLETKGKLFLDRLERLQIWSETGLIQTGGIFKRKQYLDCPFRKMVVNVHRENINSYAVNKRKGEISESKSHLSDQMQFPPKRMRDVKSITLSEMDPTIDQIYENKMIDLTIIEDPKLFYPSIHLVAEDNNGEVTRLYIYNVDKTEENLKMLGFGTKIAILNPYMRIALDKTNGIRNDNPNCLIYLQSVKNMCRYCGMENALLTCVRCKRARYCSRECQKEDWKKFNHKLICGNVYHLHCERYREQSKQDGRHVTLPPADLIRPALLEIFRYLKLVA